MVVGSVSRDTFVVFANAFSRLGMTSLYFVLRGMLDRFHYLNYPARRAEQLRGSSVSVIVSLVRAVGTLNA